MNDEQTKAETNTMPRVLHDCGPEAGGEWYENRYEDFRDEVGFFAHDAGAGLAVTRCYETEDGRLWVDNDEYNNRVNFCPFCGFKARAQVKRREK